MSIEPLSEYIKQNRDIKGINYGLAETKIGHYADDTFLTLEHTEASSGAVMKSFLDFGKISGLNINIDKTQAIKLGQIDQEINCPVRNIPYSSNYWAFILVPI